MSLKGHFSRFLSADPDRLHFAAHSHHPWPDVSLSAHERAWLDAAEFVDSKWSRVLGEVLPEAQGHVARLLGLPDPATVVFATNTHELVVRLLSCLPRPARVLTTDAEFMSFDRQLRRWEEERLVEAERVPAHPYATFPARFGDTAAAGGHDLVFFSQVHFDSAYSVRDLGDVVAAVPDESTFVVVDGYHGFMALPTDLAPVADRAFYLAGGYKYAMAGEGAVFMHCPPGYGSRPVDTGWFAAFDAVGDDAGAIVTYPPGGLRFAGATFDPTALYRFNAVQRWLLDLGVTVGDIHAHARGLQARFLDALDGLGLAGLSSAALAPGVGVGDRGHFLTFRFDGAGEAVGALRGANVVVDHRGDRLRFGFGIYHDLLDVDVLCDRLVATLR